MDLQQVIQTYVQRSKKVYARCWLICGWILRSTPVLEVMGLLRRRHHQHVHLRHHHHHLLLRHQRRDKGLTLRRNLVSILNTRLSRIHHQPMERDSGSVTRQWGNTASEVLLSIFGLLEHFLFDFLIW